MFYSSKPEDDNWRTNDRCNVESQLPSSQADGSEIDGYSGFPAVSAWIHKLWKPPSSHGFDASSLDTSGSEGDGFETDCFAEGDGSETDCFAEEHNRWKQPSSHGSDASSLDTSVSEGDGFETDCFAEGDGSETDCFAEALMPWEEALMPWDIESSPMVPRPCPQARAPRGANIGHVPVWGTPQAPDPEVRAKKQPRATELPAAAAKRRRSKNGPLCERKPDQQLPEGWEEQSNIVKPKTVGAVLEQLSKFADGWDIDLKDLQGKYFTCEPNSETLHRPCPEGQNERVQKALSYIMREHSPFTRRVVVPPGTTEWEYDKNAKALHLPNPPTKLTKWIKELDNQSLQRELIYEVSEEKLKLQSTEERRPRSINLQVPAGIDTAQISDSDLAKTIADELCDADPTGDPTITWSGDRRSIHIQVGKRKFLLQDKLRAKLQAAVSRNSMAVCPKGNLREQYKTKIKKRAGTAGDRMFEHATLKGTDEIIAGLDPSELKETYKQARKNNMKGFYVWRALAMEEKAKPPCSSATGNSASPPASNCTKSKWTFAKVAVVCGALVSAMAALRETPTPVQDAGQTQSQDCNIQECPIDCVGDYGDDTAWSACPVTCGGGTQTRP
eukprot:COSAG02_NODE_5736_length_4079_cov_3.219598_5_plen_614_part_01